MIDISQWRAAIGTFNQRETNHIPMRDDISNILHQCHDNEEFMSNFNHVLVCAYVLHLLIMLMLEYTKHIYSSINAIFIIYGSTNHCTFKENYEDTLLLITKFTFLQLILSGHIESNSGPSVYKNCPVCNKMVHLRSKACSFCECKFKKKVKGISKNRKSSVMSGVDIESYRSTNIPVTRSPNPPPLTHIEVSKSSFINSSQKWAKCKEQTNAKRCLLYKQNPERKNI